MSLSHNEQIARFGMTTAQAHAVRDKALACGIDQTAARAAWLALSNELRGDVGNQFAGQRHPEATRLHMLAALANGATIEAATDAARAFAFTAQPMTDDQLHARLEAQGYAKEHNGGGTFIYRKGNVVVSGADGDLPSVHWFMVGIYADWANDAESVVHTFTDWSGFPEFADMGGPRDIWADLADAELMATRYGEAIADGATHDAAARDARFFTDNGTADDARAMMAENDAAQGPCPDLHAYCVQVIARNEPKPA